MTGLHRSEPVKAPAPAAASRGTGGGKGPETPHGRKILVVEDQEAVRAVACGFLTDFGYDVIEAEDGFQALAKLQENPDIDLMFSDVVMPGGMNGFDLAQAANGDAARASRSSTPRAIPRAPWCIRKSRVSARASSS